jgi:hypothetical protein
MRQEMEVPFFLYAVLRAHSALASETTCNL